MVKTFVYFWGLLGLIFVRDSQMPTEQREVGICGMICQSLYLSYASASQSAVLAHAVATTPKRGEHAIRATGPAWPAGSAAHGRRGAARVPRAQDAVAAAGEDRAAARRERGRRHCHARSPPAADGAANAAAASPSNASRRRADARLAGDQRRLAVGREPVWKSTGLGCMAWGARNLISTQARTRGAPSGPAPRARPPPRAPRPPPARRGRRGTSRKAPRGSAARRRAPARRRPARRRTPRRRRRRARRARTATGAWRGRRDASAANTSRRATAARRCAASQRTHVPSSPRLKKASEAGDGARPQTGAAWPSNARR